MRREKRTMTSVTRSIPRLLSDTGQKKNTLKDVRRISFQRPKGTMEYVVSIRFSVWSRCFCLHTAPAPLCVCLCVCLCCRVYTQPHVCNYVWDGYLSMHIGYDWWCCYYVGLDFNAVYYASLPAVLKREPRIINRLLLCEHLRERELSHVLLRWP